MSDKIDKRYKRAARARIHYLHVANESHVPSRRTCVRFTPSGRLAKSPAVRATARYAVNPETNNFVAFIIPSPYVTLDINTATTSHDTAIVKHQRRLSSQGTNIPGGLRVRIISFIVIVN